MKNFIYIFLVMLVSYGQCSIIKKPPAKPVDTTWSDLVCTEQDRANIYEIVSTVSEKNKLSLLVNQSTLREKGAQITHVHPLKFLGVIFSDSYLKSCMSLIWNDYFKRNSFVTDLTAALNREADRDKLYAYLNEFANEVGLLPESLKPFFDERDWDNFFLFLIRS